MRQAPSVSALHKASFYGISRTISPLTREEIEEAGFSLAPVTEGYVEDDAPLCWGQLATLGLIDSHLILQGEVSGGKDIFPAQYAHTFNLPYMGFGFREGTSPNDWVTRTDLVEGERGGTITEIVEGSLLKACRGVTAKRDFTMLSLSEREALKSQMEDSNYTVSDSDGIFTITVPAIVLFSDYDRASFAHLEMVRNALELDKERLVHPITGELIPILKGTRFVFTANSGSDGSDSSNNIFNSKDGSLLSRMSAVFVPPIEKKFERMVIAKAFPVLDTDEVRLLVDCIHAVRKVAKESPMGLEVSLRQTKQWASHALRAMRDLPDLCPTFREALPVGFHFLKGHLGTEMNRSAMEGAVASLLEGVIENTEVEDTRCPIDR